MKIEVTACDIDRQVPALTYTLSTSDGRSVTADLCAAHGEEIERLFREFGASRTDANGQDQIAGGAPTLRGEVTESVDSVSPAPAGPEAGPVEAESDPPGTEAERQAKPGSKSKQARKAPAAKRTTRTRARNPRFATMEEIEAKKQAEGK